MTFVLSLTQMVECKSPPDRDRTMQSPFAEMGMQQGWINCVRMNRLYKTTRFAPTCQNPVHMKTWKILCPALDRRSIVIRGEEPHSRLIVFCSSPRVSNLIHMNKVVFIAITLYYIGLSTYFLLA